MIDERCQKCLSNDMGLAIAEKFCARCGKQLKYNYVKPFHCRYCGRKRFMIYLKCPNFPVQMQWHKYEESNGHDNHSCGTS